MISPTVVVLVLSGAALVIIVLSAISDIAADSRRA
jgi:hypothetical protein